MFNPNFMKRIFLSFLLLWSVNLVHAQIQQIWNINLFLGVSYNSVYDPANFDYKFSPLLAGFEFEKQLSNRFDFGTSLSFVRKGTRTKLNNGVRDATYMFDYIILSPQLKINVFTNKALAFAIGPYLGYSTSTKMKTFFDSHYRDYKHNDFQDLDFGVDLGIRSEFGISKYDFYVHPKLQLGLIDFSYSKHISCQVVFGIKI
jgi:hypothetical protein